METAQATMVGILTMRGYVIEYSKGNYIFCTEEELEYYKEQDKKAQFEYETKQRDNTSENPARPNGVKITRDCMVIEYQSYKACTEYPVRMSIAKAKGYLTPPYIFGIAHILNFYVKRIASFVIVLFMHEICLMN